MDTVWLIILDGFWINPQSNNNAIAQANSPTINALFSEKYTSLHASWKYVWLPEWQSWNSEVWHLTIGSGRLLKQSLVEINELISSWKFEDIQEFQDGLAHCKKNNSKLHLFSLFGQGWVHSSMIILEWVIKLIPSDIKVCLHLFADGRDTAKDAMLPELEEFIEFIEPFKNVNITSISWRYFAMDRNNNWDRIEHVYNTLVAPTNVSSISPLDHIRQNYKNEIFDEVLEWVNFTWDIIEDSDSIFHLNFRSDRANQLVKAFYEKEISFERKNHKNLYIATMTKFYKEYDGHVFIKSQDINNTLSEVLAQNNLTQFHLAETEKFAHVTKFFNWGKNTLSPWEKHMLIASPDVKDYVMTPAMSAYKVLETYRNEAENYDFTVINFANGDMLWHTWDMEAAKKTIEVLDDIVSQLIVFSKEKHIDLFITADHGNCEVMFDEKWEIVKSHTNNLVPFWHIHNWEFSELKIKSWTLADIAPTILDNMWINIPQEMTGKSLL